MNILLWCTRLAWVKARPIGALRGDSSRSLSIAVSMASQIGVEYVRGQGFDYKELLRTARHKSTFAYIDRGVDVVIIAETPCYCIGRFLKSSSTPPLHLVYVGFLGKCNTHSALQYETKYSPIDQLQGM